MTVSGEEFIVFLRRLANVEEFQDKGGYVERFLVSFNPMTLYVVKNQEACLVTNDLSDTRNLEKARNIVLFMKRQGRLDFLESITVLNIPTSGLTNSNELVENLRNILNVGISPYFDLITGNNSSNLKDNTKNKLRELSLSLQHLQQKIQIPNLLMSTHPQIIKLLQKEISETELVNNSSFLNELTNIVNDWVKQIRSITSLNHDPHDGDSVLDESIFWRSFESSLTSIEQQIESYEVQASINILDKARRFHTTLSFKNNIGVKDRLNEAKLYNSILKDFPINGIFAYSTDAKLDELEGCINHLFSHFKKLRYLNSYPITRAIQTIEVTLKDVANLLASLISSFSLMSIHYTEFVDVIKTKIMRLFDVVDNCLNDCTNLLRELLRKRQEKFFIVRINHDCVDKLKKYIESYWSLRSKHNDLLQIMTHLFPESNEPRKLMKAYEEYIIPCNIVELNSQNKHVNKSNVGFYMSVYVELEKITSSRLSEFFQLCECFEDYLVVFNKFQINGEISGHLLSLINDSVKLELLASIDCRINLLVHSGSHPAGMDCGLSEISNKIYLYEENSSVSQIFRTIRIRNKLKWYLHIMPRILGPSWSKYTIGNEISLKIGTFLRQNEISNLFESWLSQVSDLRIDLQGRIFKVATSPEYDIFVNFDYRVIQWYKELGTLRNLGFLIPASILMNFKNAERLIPFANALSASLLIIKRILKEDLQTRSYGKALGFTLQKKVFQIMSIVPHVLEMQWYQVFHASNMKTLGSELRNEEFEDLKETQSIKILLYFQEEISVLSNQTNKLEQFYEEVYLDSMIQLKQCPYNFDAIDDILDRLRTGVINLSLEEFTGLDTMCTIFNNELIDVLNHKFEVYIDNLVGKLKPPHASEENAWSIRLILTLHNLSLLTMPSMYEIKKQLLEKLNVAFRVVEEQKLPGVPNNRPAENYSLLRPNTSQGRVKCFMDAVDELMEKLSVYYLKWKKFQYFLELDLNSRDRLLKILPHPESINSWLQLISEVQNLSHLFDSVNSEFWIGNICVDFSNIKHRASSEYEGLMKRTIGIFGSVFESVLIETENFFEYTRPSLERKLSIDKEFYILLEEIAELLNIEYRLEEIDVQTLKQGQTCLFKFRFEFPSGWTYVEQIENNLSVFHKLLITKTNSLLKNEKLLVSRFQTESRKLNDSMRSLKSSWSSSKPTSVKMAPSTTRDLLNKFDNECSTLLKKRATILKVSSHFSYPINKIDDLTIVAEIHEMKSVWSLICDKWEELEKLSSIKWKDIDLIELRRSLEILATQKAVPNISHYNGYNDFQKSIKARLKHYGILCELKNSQMRSRHWDTLFSKVGKKAPSYDDLSLRDVWDLNFEDNEKEIQVILFQAKNEKTIEVHLEKIWNESSNMRFEQVTSKNGQYILIRNCKKMVQKCDNFLNELKSMESSPSYNVFEKRINDLRDKLNTFFVLLDLINVLQGEWINLEGLFLNEESSIRHILPIEYSKFNNVSYHFMSSLKSMLEANSFFEIITLNNLQYTLSTFLDDLLKLRKNLNGFLEKQREKFARFYFLGNEDLLELIGSPSDVGKINKHIKKLFSGVVFLEKKEGSPSITSVYGEKNEKLRLLKPISPSSFSHLNEWLFELEKEIKVTLFRLTKEASLSFKEFFHGSELLDEGKLVELMEMFPDQVIFLVCKIYFKELVETSVQQRTLDVTYSFYETAIQQLSQLISWDTPLLRRLKIEHMIIEFIYCRDVVFDMKQCIDDSLRAFLWSKEQLFHFDEQCADATKSLLVSQCGTNFVYGFEYLGVTDKLAYTPLLNKCFSAMTTALSENKGGCPFGPAGTGKTESIKAFGNSLGKMVVIFCCDESFDLLSISRILRGISKTSCWACFDEFNRLEENTLSAISSQIELIEQGLRSNNMQISLRGKKNLISPDIGIFVTMNPEYSGRSDLPENLRALFRNFSMAKPDIRIIVEILLLSQNFLDAKNLSLIVVKFFYELGKRLSQQPHYDFSLRSIKACLTKCGLFRRKFGKGDKVWERKLLLRSISETIRPRLIRSEEKIFLDLLVEYFHTLDYDLEDNHNLVTVLKEQMIAGGLAILDNLLNKAMQILETEKTSSGIILMGESGSGKSVAIRQLFKALCAIEGIQHSIYYIDAKVLSKENLFGHLDPVTRDWSDGLLPKILRSQPLALESGTFKRVWIVFDGDIDPTWAENLNSVLDDNKILTLPNGERLQLSPNFKIFFEVDSLKYATPATITRCGMIWFDKSFLNLHHLFHHMLFHLEIGLNMDVRDDTIYKGEFISNIVRDTIREVLEPNNLSEINRHASSISHAMEYNGERALATFFTLMRSYCRRLIKYVKYNESGPVDDIKRYIKYCTYLCIGWGFAGDCTIADREIFVLQLKDSAFHNLKMPTEMANSHKSYMDYDISLPRCDLVAWENSIKEIELDPYDLNNPNLVVPTEDTAKHENLIYSFLQEHKTLLLCGPPGSGKTMTLLGALRRSPNLSVVMLNLSKDTGINSLLASMEQVCAYRKTNNGLLLTPKELTKWVVFFCDEINLPDYDAYGTQKVISFLRQMVEYNGFWSAKEKLWVTLSNIQFIGACNPPSDPGRNVISPRFLRQVSLIMVDYPSRPALFQIYKTFNFAIMKNAPNVQRFIGSITELMIDIYENTKMTLNTDMQSHYTYSPRELTRWCKGLWNGVKALHNISLDQILRLIYYEGLRLFYDRLVGEFEKNWTKHLFYDSLKKNFPNNDPSSVFKEPIFYSDWLSLTYESVSEKDLRNFVQERLRIFNEEEENLALVPHNDFLDHCLRIDRVLRQPQGHLILIGDSASGKYTLAKFVSWINCVRFIPLRVHSGFTLLEFDKKLKELLKFCVSGDKVCFFIDESSILHTSFIERMNTLLANAEVPGLFETEEIKELEALYRVKSKKLGVIQSEVEDGSSWLSRMISENLHVVFALSHVAQPNQPGLYTSPALFNRCVLCWMGSWSIKTLAQITSELIKSIPIDRSEFTTCETFDKFTGIDIKSFRDVVIDSIVYIHCLKANGICFSQTNYTLISFVSLFVEFFNRMQMNLEDSQRRISNGLDKLRNTIVQINDLQSKLAIKKELLLNKNKESREMLNKMLSGQNEAERKEEFSLITQEELKEQDIEISQRKVKVTRDLEIAEPEILDAQRGVKNIKKQHLTEIRSMSNPPAPVKMTLESVCILLGYQFTTWREVQLIVRRDDFISNIVIFNNERQITEETREYMEKNYLIRSDYNYETVNRASKACGPLLLWVEAQLNYSRVLESVLPLREEVISLETKRKNTKAQLIAIDEMISELRVSIEKYKDDYSLLIRETESIKLEMAAVEEKVNRSLKLIENLAKERERWKLSVEKFKSRSGCVTGDALLAAAFITYAGAHDQKDRQRLLNAWKKRLCDSGILFEEKSAVHKNLLSPSRLLQMEGVGILNDELSAENFAILDNIQYPLIIDPTGKSVESIINMSPQLNVCVLSFLQDNFTAMLENQIRFGGTVLIQDAEYYNPIMNSLLRKDIAKYGGQTVLNLGTKEIDFSPHFRLIFFTKDPLIRLPSLAAARVNVVNFTITDGNLEDVIISKTLKLQNPEVEQQRLELRDAQIKYHIQLFNLEEDLLKSLGKSTLSLLEDDQVLTNLEQLKRDANFVDLKILEAVEIQRTVEDAAYEYSIISKHAIFIFNVLRKYRNHDLFYQFSMKEFLEAYSSISERKHENISSLIECLYKEVYCRFAPSLKLSDKGALALSLLFGFHSLEINKSFEDSFKLIIDILASSNRQFDIKAILRAAEAHFHEEQEITERDLETVYELDTENETFRVLFGIIRALLKWKQGYLKDLISAITESLNFVCACGDLQNNEFDLSDWCSERLDKGAPFLLASLENCDVTSKIQRIALQEEKKLAVVSMGSKEKTASADEELDIAAKAGSWLMVQNIHMSPEWLQVLEKKLNSLGALPSFKLFLTCKISSNIPNALVHRSKVLIFERQTGLKASMREFCHANFEDMYYFKSKKYCRASFTFIWFHLLIQERMKYFPIAFSKMYDLSDWDMESGIHILDKLWPSEKESDGFELAFFWKQFKYIIADIIYGGRMDNEKDLMYVRDLSDDLFNNSVFDDDFNLIKNEFTDYTQETLVIPDDFCIEKLDEWVSLLPDEIPLAWLKLKEEVRAELYDEKWRDSARVALRLID